jgi:hypothetical protein
MQESVNSRIFVSKKGMIRVCPMDVCTRNIWQKAESVLLRETNAFCARNMGTHVRRTSSECPRYKKRDKKSDSRAAKKGHEEISK